MGVSCGQPQAVWGSCRGHSNTRSDSEGRLQLIHQTLTCVGWFLVHQPSCHVHVDSSDARGCARCWRRW